MLPSSIMRMHGSQAQYRALRQGHAGMERVYQVTLSVAGHASTYGSVIRIAAPPQARTRCRDSVRVSHTCRSLALCQALNVLGDTPWRINWGVAVVLQALWDEGGGVGGLVNRGDVSFVPVLAHNLMRHPIS